MFVNREIVVPLVIYIFFASRSSDLQDEIPPAGLESFPEGNGETSIPQSGGAYEMSAPDLNQDDRKSITAFPEARLSDG